MRVAQVGKLFPPHVGGVEVHMQLLAEHLSAEAQTLVTVICGQSAAASASRHAVGKYQVIRLATAGCALSTPIAFGLADAIARAEPDCLHFHSPYPWADLTAARPFAGIPLVVTHHMDIVRQAWALPIVGRLYGRTLDTARTVIATSAQQVDSSPWLNTRRRKVAVVPLGIDVDRWKTLAAQPVAAHWSAVVGRLRRPIHLFVGRLVYYKGLAELIRATTGLAGSVVVVGHGPLRGELEHLARQLSAPVSFLGAVDDQSLCDLYRLADVFVLPSTSRAEAFGMVLLEAALHGLPLVTCRIGTGVEFVNLEGVTGLQVPPGDVDALRDALRRLEANPPLRAELGEAARTRVQQMFAMQVVGPQVRDVLTTAARR